jgi:phosphoglycerol transferase MdoB-like AlkP superfamily enzyme
MTMKKLFYRLPFYIRFHLVIALASFLALSIYRLAFFIVYSYRIKEGTPFLILKAFLLGIRFDIAAICILIGFTLVLSSIHFLNKYKVARFIWRSIPSILVIALLFLLIADIIYYENGNKHLGYEAFAYLGLELLPLVGSAFAQNPFLFLFGFLVIAGIVFLIYKIQKKYPYEHNEMKLFYGVFQFFLIAGLLILGIRGGFQSSPLRTSDAIVSKESLMNDLALNPWFTVVTDMKMTKVDTRHFMEKEEAVRLVRKQITYPGSEFVSEEYPLLRKITTKANNRLPNIVILVLEGWTGKYIDMIGNGKVSGKEVTPYFNQLIKKGAFFNRFFASGGRTTNGLMALIGGVPDRPGLTAVRTPQILSRFSGLGNIGKTIGYETLFVTGTDLSFNNKGSIMFHWGFDTLIGKNELEKNPEYKTGPWSYLDESALDAMHKKILSSPKDKPVMAVIHTGTTHYPYLTPDDKYKLFDKDVQDFEYLNVLHYADWAVNDYLENAKKAEYFKDTVFFFISDHSHHRFLNYLEDRHVPFLIYAPGKVEPELRTDITSQLDFLPTVLGFMEKEIYFSAMGRDLRKVNGNSAYFAYGNIFGWIDNDFLYFQSVAGGLGETKSIKPPFVDLGLCQIAIEKCKVHNENTRAYLNLSDELLRLNKLFPSEKELIEIKSNTRNP